MQFLTAALWRVFPALMFAFCVASETTAITIRHDKTEADYIALSTDPKWSAAGAFTSTSTCTASGGALIHPEWVMTAGHCLNASAEFTLGADRSNPDVQVAVDFTSRHPDYSSNVGNGKDLGLAKLVSPILDVTPARLYRLLFGEAQQTATVIGYGRFGTGATGETTGGVGIRRAGQNHIDGFGFLGTNINVMFTDFDNPGNAADNWFGPVTPLEFEHGIAFYDSGSGWFADIDGKTYLIGVTSFRTNRDGSDNSDYGDGFGGTRVGRERVWIDSAHDMTMFWDPAQTGDWGTAGDWEVSMEPAAANAAVIDGGHVTVSQMDETAKYTFLVGNGQLTLSNTLTTNNFLLRESGMLGIDLPTGAAMIDGAYAQSGGTLEIDLGGTAVGEYDQLDVTGAAELGGDLSIAPNSGFGSNANRGQMDTFTVLNADSIQGAFDNETFNGEPLDTTMGYVGEAGDGRDGMFAAISYTGSSVEVSTYFALDGDANGDGFVNGADFVIWNDNKFTSGTDWTTGDFNNDGITDGQDFVVWNNNKFTSVDSNLVLPAVPEPRFAAWLLLPILAVLARFVRTR